MSQADEQYVEIWGDRVSMRDLVLALAVTAAATVAAVVVGRALGSSEFFWGLGGAVVGFGASMALVRPKRDVRIVADEDTEAGPPPA
ncbi:hypothetical protein [Cellulomonas pakistanensis]|uniref:Uncharacterized protein n=1 Tax=Cellulomonas pakistanensis TaxID=992287 RepID=A0A919P5J0_9CELL|nr:hypothetical protein [Cellulomonas pakistanensis]GIG34650.1 hypothetical protein Cpa01nite_00310 [Cellulomonas pakistanensis]